jgi:tetrapyrrole methylase family protein/MazG family protein
MSEPVDARLLVVGLGPGDPTLRTVGAQRALDGAARIVLRTRIHPGLEDLRGDPRVSDCDDLYAGSRSFKEVYAAIAERVLRLAAESDGGQVVFAVPGHPRFGEESVRLIEARGAAQGIAVAVAVGVSAIDAVAGALAVDPMVDEVQLLDALALAAAVERDPFAGGSVAVDPLRPCLIGQLYAPHVAAAVKLALGRLYPDDHPLVLVRAAAVPDEERLTRCRLFELDRRPVDHLTSAWVPAMEALTAFRSPAELQRIVALLRAPGGCPWDREQSHQSLRPAVIEEAYEVVDAIDRDDADNLEEELGDLLLQVVLHAQIAEEAGTFGLEDVFERVGRKLIRRHPHVFGAVEARTAGDVVTTWEAVKAEERAGRGGAVTKHPLDRLPRSMPALLRAASLLGSWKQVAPRAPDPETVDAVGDALLAAVESSVRAGVDPERALDAALRRRVSGEATHEAPAENGLARAGGNPRS